MTDMRQIQIRRPAKRAAAGDYDLRTPSGRVLPF
jgi:hypothetical protein